MFMKKAERYFIITQELHKKGQVTVLKLASLCQVAGETIRRDLDEMEKSGALKRVHGGAVSLQNVVEAELDIRFEQDIEAKKEIAQKALQIIKPQSSLYMDFGSTTLAFAAELHHIDDLTIYTNSPLLAQTIATNNNLSHKVYILGGQYCPNLRENLGYMTLEAIRQTFVDVAVIGAYAIDEKLGFMDMNDDETEIAKAMLSYAHNKIILADRSKFFKKGRKPISPFEGIDYLISSGEPLEDMQKICDKYKIHYM